MVAAVAGGLLAAAPASAAGDGKVTRVRRPVSARRVGGGRTCRDQVPGRHGCRGDLGDRRGQGQDQEPGLRRGAIGSRALAGVTRNRIIGYAEPALREKVDDVESLIAARGVAPAAAQAVDAEPLAGLQWDMDMIHATAEESYAVSTGNPDVRVGIIDTGIDASHPDLAPNFDADLSRNFTTDIPLIDGPCNQEPDHSCEDPADVDEGGHGTHVAGTVAAALNGLGIAGVAPNVTLVNLRAGQDSGFFFLFETLEALHLRGRQRHRRRQHELLHRPVVGNCPDNPLDSLEEQIEQRTIIQLSNQALDYAHANGVTLIAAEGNEHTDLGNPTYDAISPDYPPGSEKVRDNITNDCLVIPTEGNHVISVSALVPPGGRRTTRTTGSSRPSCRLPAVTVASSSARRSITQPGLRVLSTYPAELAMEEKLITRNFKPRTPLAVVDCEGKPSKSTCGVYAYLQGTSMASPHATGVAALIISAIGSYDPETGEFGADPAAVEAALRSTATNADEFFTAMGEDWRDFCPEPPTTVPLRRSHPPSDPPDWDALCEGDADFNGFYGDGVVNALAAASL